MSITKGVMGTRVTNRQQLESGAEASKANAKKAARRLVKSIGTVLLILAIFGLGLGIGNGSISFEAAATTKNGSQLPANLDYTSVEQVYDTIRENYDGKITETQLLDGLKAGLTKATGDPYTEYFNKSEAADFRNELHGSFTGIGAELGLNASSALIVVTPIKGFPADKAGLRSQDIITSIDGKTTSGMSISDAVSRIRGKEGTQVMLQILRGEEELKLTITRDQITVPSVTWKVRDDGVGVMTITQFNDDTVSLAQQAAREFKDKSVHGVVLDLRGNPGGALDAAVGIASLWLPKGKVVLQEKTGGIVVDTRYAEGSTILQAMPTRVLINAGSASASEIVAGALRDNHVATLVGEKSYGKGSVQSVLPLRGGTEMKVTVARWYRPNGQNIDKKGIAPDVMVTMSDDDYKNQRDPQMDQAIDKLHDQ